MQQIMPQRPFTGVYSPEQSGAMVGTQNPMAQLGAMQQRMSGLESLLQYLQSSPMAQNPAGTGSGTPYGYDAQALNNLYGAPMSVMQPHNVSPLFSGIGSLTGGEVL